jgi:hypothetical protein
MSSAVIVVAVFKHRGFRDNRGEAAVTMVCGMACCTKDDAVVQRSQPLIGRPIFAAALLRDHMMGVFL